MLSKHRNKYLMPPGPLNQHLNLQTATTEPALTSVLVVEEEPIKVPEPIIY